MRKGENSSNMGEDSPRKSDHPPCKKSKTNHQSENPSISILEPLTHLALPEELITEILLRLPVKPLSQFKCVSKSLCSLISSPEFIRSHVFTSSREGQYLNHQLLFTNLAPNSGLTKCSLQSALHEPSTQVCDIDYPSEQHDDIDSIWVVGSVNGLVCLAIEERDLYIWNPSLNKSKPLPSSNIRLRDGGYVIYGFGYDEFTDDYKVVSLLCVYRIGGVYETEVKVYSLKEDSWKKIEDFKGGAPLDETGKYACGKIHWAVSQSFESNENWKVVTLDVRNEEYGELNMPDFERGVYDWTFGVVGERLFLLCDYENTRGDLWVMDKYGVEESWAILVSIPYDFHPGPSNYMPQILCLLENNEVVLTMGSDLVVYNSKQNQFRILMSDDDIEFYEGGVYVESLVSPTPYEG